MEDKGNARVKEGGPKKESFQRFKEILYHIFLCTVGVFGWRGCVGCWECYFSYNMRLCILHIIYNIIANIAIVL